MAKLKAGNHSLHDKMERILRLVYQATWDLAQSDERPTLLPR